MVMSLLAALTFVLGTRWDAYDPVFGIGAVVFMALNALAAVYPLYRFPRKNPFNTYVLGMLVRLAAIGMALTVLISQAGLTRGGLMAVTVTAMISFLAYQAVEIGHFVRHPESFQSR
jgi:hypothetical protein